MKIMWKKFKNNKDKKKKKLKKKIKKNKIIFNYKNSNNKNKINLKKMHKKINALSANVKLMKMIVRENVFAVKNKIINHLIFKKKANRLILIFKVIYWFKHN